tara:strand:- start:1115 stop:1750 length:636 start_codon:yes stop_codon:yes gene_type:complete
MSTRDLTPSTLDSLDDDVLYPFFAVEMLFDGNQTLRLWTGYGTLNYQGLEWYGTGSMLQIDSVEETTEIAARGASLTMSGIPEEVLALALREPYQGRKANIYFGNFTQGLLQLESSDFILFEDGSRIELEVGTTNLSQIFTGYMDQMNIEETPDTCTVQLTLENKLVDLERARVSRFTSAYQKSKYPQDKGLEFVEGLQDKEIVWGRNSGS